MSVESLIERARELDGGDELGGARKGFFLPEGVIYLDGNSLGALPTAVVERLGTVVETAWGHDLIRGWDGGWMDAPLQVGDRIARLIGALPGEVLVADTVTLALAKLLLAALRARPGRSVILSSTDNFPSDLYAAAGAARLHSAELRVVDRSELAGALDSNVAVLSLTQVDFRTGELHDLPGLTERAHDAGALCLWDLCHSAGSLVVGCEENGVDLAVGCTYKYLNGGPGSPSFLYVRRSLQDELENPLPGWLGHAAPFDFDARWRQAGGIVRFLTSSPPILGISALDAALDAFEGLEMASVRAKSLALTGLFIEAIDELGAEAGLEVATPCDPDRRGSQVSLRHARASDVVAGARRRGVVGDFRSPDLCRFGFAPLYLSFEEVVRGAEVISEVAAEIV